MNRGTLVVVLQLVGVGWYVAVCIILGLLGGLWLDSKLDTLPIFTLVGVLLGTVLTFYGVYRMVLPLLNGNRQPEDKDEGQ